MSTRFVVTLLTITLLAASSPTWASKKIRLTKHVKDSLRTEIEKMDVEDQKYRWMLSFGEIDSERVSKWRQMDDSVQFARMRLVMNHKAGIDSKQLDSIGNLQDAIDSANFFRLMAIIEKYGFPRRYIASYKVTTILCHFSDGFRDGRLFKILKDEVLIGRMGATEFARLFDNVSWKQGQPELYFVNYKYNASTETSTTGTPKNLEQTNKARKEIGLKKYRPKTLKD